VFVGFAAMENLGFWEKIINIEKQYT